MRIFVPLLLALTVIPLVEWSLLVALTNAIGFVPTLAIVLLTGSAGAALARAQGLRTWFEFRRQSAEGRVPTGPIADGAMILVAAAFLVTPGVLTDAVGFSLLVPPVRTVLKRLLAHYFAAGVSVRTFGFGGDHGVPPFASDRPEPPHDANSTDVIDAEFERRS